MAYTVCRGTEDDADALARLIYQSGPANIEGVFCHEICDRDPPEKHVYCIDYIRQALLFPEGQFGYRNQYVIRDENLTIACVSFWTCVLSESFKQATLSNLLAHFGAVKCATIIKNSELLSELVRRPSVDELSIGHLSVDPKFQRQGLATTLLAYCQQQAKLLGKSSLILDLAADNTDALATYRSFGFSEVGMSEPGPAATRAGMVAHIHMVKKLH